MAAHLSKGFNSRDFVACVAILVALLAGKLQIPVGLVGIPSGFWSEIRLWGLLLAAALLLTDMRIRDLRKLQEPALVCFLLLLTYLAARSLFDATIYTPAKQIDLIYLAVQSVLIGFVTLRAHRIQIVAYTTIALALLYFMVALAGQLFESLGSRTNLGMGWGPVGGPITFNRVQFLAFCASMCLAVHTPVRRLVFYTLAALFLFATLASLQKAAILSAYIAVSFAASWLILRRRFASAGILAVVTVVASTAMFGTYGDRLSGRVDRMTTTRSPVEERATVVPPPPSEDPQLPTENIEIPSIPPDTGAQAETAPQASEASEPSEPAEPAEPAEASDPSNFVIEDVAQPKTDFQIEALGVLVRWCVYGGSLAGSSVPKLNCPSFEFTDRTSRLTFWAEAVLGFLRSPVFGLGIASYSVSVPHPDTLLPDNYLYPHNMVFELAYEGGSIALGLLAVALAFAVRASLLSSASIRTRVYTMTFMVFLFVGTMFAGDFYDTRLFWFGAIILGTWKAGERAQA